MSLDSILREPSGKNLFDKTIPISSYDIDSDVQAAGYFALRFYVGIGTPVTISFAAPTEAFTGMYMFITFSHLAKYEQSAITKYQYLLLGTEVIKTTATNTSTDGYVSFVITEKTYNFIINNNLQIEIGSTATSYEPYRQGPETVTIPYSGKNLIKFPYEETTKTLNGVTFTVGDDGGITVSGTATDTTVFTINSPIQLEQGKQYTLSGYSEQAENSDSLMTIHAAGDLQAVDVTQQYQTATFTANYTTYYMYIAVRGGSTANETFYPQLEEGITATDYSLNTGDKEVWKVSYGSRNLWQNTNTTFPSTLSYDSNTQTYTIGTGTTGYQFIAHKLDNPIPAGTVVTISAYFQSGKGKGCVFGGYHRTGDTSWQGHIDIPTDTDMTGKTLTQTFTTTKTVEEFEVFHNTGDNIEEPYVFRVQYELGNKATDYVPYSKEQVWKSTNYNLLPIPTQATQTITGITFTNNSDGTITVNGTATANSTYNLGTFTIPTNYELKLSGCPSGGSTSSYYLYAYDTTSNKTYSDTGSGVTFTSTSGSVNIYIRVQSEQTVDGLVFEPKLEFV